MGIFQSMTFQSGLNRSRKGFSPRVAQVLQTLTQQVDWL